MSQDITFCGYAKCSYTECERNQSNIINHNIYHSFAYFHDCDKYPPMEFSQKEQQQLKSLINSGENR